MAIEIVDFPIKNGGSFHSYGTVYQRVPDNYCIPQLSLCRHFLVEYLFWPNIGYPN